MSFMASCSVVVKVSMDQNQQSCTVPQCGE